MKNQFFLLGLLTIFAASVSGATLIYLFTENASFLAFIGWTLMFAAPQITLLPVYSNVSCRLLKTANKK